jgi:hypothetical protein
MFHSKRGQSRLRKIPLASKFLGHVEAVSIVGLCASDDPNSEEKKGPDDLCWTAPKLKVACPQSGVLGSLANQGSTRINNQGRSDTNENP